MPRTTLSPRTSSGRMIGWPTGLHIKTSAAAFLEEEASSAPTKVHSTRPAAIWSAGAPSATLPNATAVGRKKGGHETLHAVHTIGTWQLWRKRRSPISMASGPAPSRTGARNQSMMGEPMTRTTAQKNKRSRHRVRKRSLLSLQGTEGETRSDWELPIHRARSSSRQRFSGSDSATGSMFEEDVDSRCVRGCDVRGNDVRGCETESGTAAQLGCLRLNAPSALGPSSASSCDPSRPEERWPLARIASFTVRNSVCRFS
mmetsp:Transcript_43906/g.121498  ORF Transcript_43906/g.121498 Transcript_43906/m.121498 type:complete len:258 (+) Transcript_43906:867-1640(+)